MADTKVDAPFVFEGTVKLLNSSNVKSVPADKSTAVVAVDHVRQAPRALAGLAGKEITLRMAPSEKLKAGDKAVFSADGLVFAENLALQSRGHDLLENVTHTAAVLGAAPVVERLRRRVNDAKMIVSGRVREVRPHKEPATRAAVIAAAPGERLHGTATPVRISEHEPFWQEAVIDVDHVHKGQKQKQVVVNFPSSNDVMWRKVPKFSKGQTGVFLLHGTPAQAAAKGARAISAPPANALTALDPDDYQPKNAESTVEAMLPATPLPAAPPKARAAVAKARKAASKKAARKKTAAKKRRS